MRQAKSGPNDIDIDVISNYWQVQKLDGFEGLVVSSPRVMLGPTLILKFPTHSRALCSSVHDEWQGLLTRWR
ncbi:hypothetical protein CY34DRAFT_806413 [Suillus luteus UH-Slu-Lm8-n1]|uniref:Uncharacterized protein n=1 Tax=Suillus luteus UH-Slu-Lm8-n1 TaxID=930992 RepID=A0A0D0B3U5_9AGAM|nr:hypothetical protein CY34DRAFT_806413 [Suillus luteus UH-Slu-Lm8-n1]